MMTTSIDLVGPNELAEVSRFYETVGYGGGVSGADLTLAARCDGRVIGAVRLCAEDGVIVLRGMQVAPRFQMRGAGRALLAHCVPYLDEGTAYCLPYEHLVKFYGQAGFALARPESLPPLLAERLAGYAASHRRVLAMRRERIGSVKPAAE